MKDESQNCSNSISDSANRLLSLLFVFFISLILFILYAQLNSHAFLHIDDPVYVVSNPHVTGGLSIENVVWAFTTFQAEFWHPLTWISYMVDTSVFGVRPGLYLFTNLLLHILNTLLLFYAMKTMTKQIWASALVATLFAVHPLHVEAVAWIAERKELLSGFFFMLCIHAYIRYVCQKSISRYLILCSVFIAGIMSKPMIITLPFVLLLFDFWPLERISPDWLFTPKIMPFFVEKVPLMLLSFADAWVTLLAQRQGGGMVPEAEYPFVARFANAIQSYAGYLKKTVWPVDLSVFYPFPPSIHLLSVFFCFSLLMLITFVCMIAWRRYPFLIVGWLLYLGMLFPVIGLVKVGDFAMADRFAYLPLTGIFIIFSFGMAAALNQMKRKRIVLALIFAVTLISFFRDSFRQIGYWKDSETLYLHALDVTDNNFFANYGLGNIYAQAGLTDNAINQFMSAVAIRPDKVSLWNALGRSFILKDLWGRAAMSFEQGIRRKPNEPDAYYLLGCVMAGQKKYHKAVRCFSHSLLIYLHSIGCRVDVNAIGKSKVNMPTDHAGFKNNAEPLKGMKPPCEDAKRIMLADKIMATSGPIDALSLYGIPNDPKRLREMLLAGFENWPLIRKAKRSGV